MILDARDDLLVHSGDGDGFAERWYFNVQRPDGKLVAIAGGALYPNRGVAECYACRLDDARQVNVRAVVPLAEMRVTDSAVEAGPFRFECDEPLRRWRVEVHTERIALDGTFTTGADPYPFSPFEIRPDPGDAAYDDWRHFAGPGRIEVSFGGAPETALSFRDRTWGVRSRRPRMHNWYVFHAGERFFTLVHQERADGSVLYSEAALAEADGSVHALRVRGHDVRYERGTRMVNCGRFALAGDEGPAMLEFERAGEPIRLAGAGYDPRQGTGDRRGVGGEAWDLSDPELVRRIGRGTMDAPARATLTYAGQTADAIGVVETAIARDHHRYGEQL